MHKPSGELHSEKRVGSVYLGWYLI